jgi:transcriptional regulator with XRE-family HTH domain
MEELSLKIRQKRGGMGIRAAAEKIGISPATLSRVEAGKQPDLKSFRLICKWLNIDPGLALGMQPGSGLPTDSGVPLQAHFRTSKTMGAQTAQHLANLILAVQEATKKGI